MSGLRVEQRRDAKKTEEFTSDFCRASLELRHPDYRTGMMEAATERLLLAFPGPKPKDLFVAKDGDRIVGRVLGSLANAREGVGYVGFFEVDESHKERENIARDLLERVCGYLRENGAVEAHGPICINTWFPYRFRSDDSDTQHFDWEPVNPPSYPGYFLASGFEQSETYHSELMVGIDRFVEGNRKGYELSLAKGISYRAIDTANPTADLAHIYDVSMESFADAHLFEPISREIFERIYVPSAARRRAEGCFLAFDNDDAVGLVFSFLDDRGFVIKTLAVRPPYRGMGISNGLLLLTGQRAQELGLDAAVSALVRSGNVSEFGARKTGLGWQHHYALYRKTL